MSAVIDTDDVATIIYEWHGYGRAYPPGRRHIVGSVFHFSDSDLYPASTRSCVRVDKVRAPEDPKRESSDLVIEVAELIREPAAE